MWENIKNLPSRVLSAFRAPTTSTQKQTTSPLDLTNLSVTTLPQSQLSSWERNLQNGSMTPTSFGGTQAAPAAPAMQQNMFSNALRGLNTSQREYFDSAVSRGEQGMRSTLSNLTRQEDDARNRAQRSMRSSRAAGAGRGADLRAAAASRGLLSSPASYDVGLESENARTIAEQASTAGQLSQFLGETSRARAGARDEFEQFMEQVRRDRLRNQQQNEAEFMSRLLSSQQSYFG